MFTRMISILTMVSFAACAAAQSTEAPRTGRVTDDRVYVRALPDGMHGYPCTRLNTGDRVKVVGRNGQWLKILPVKGTYSVISKQYVKPAEDGRSGTLTGDRVWTRAGGELCKWQEVTRYDGLHKQLNTGQKVTILGQDGDFYKIKPVDGAYYWISADFVAPVAAGEAPDDGQTGDVTDAGDGAAERSTTRPADDDDQTQTRPVPGDAGTDSAGDAATALAQLAEVEKALQAEYAKPADQRDHPALIKQYKAIKPGNEAVDQVVASRIQFLQNRIERKKELQQVEELLDAAKAEHAETLARLEEIDVQTQFPVRKAYDAQGVLAESSLFMGKAGQPKRWVVRDPDTQRVSAYVQSTEGLIDLDKYVGKRVGIFGDAKFVRSLSLFVVEAREVKLLGENESEKESPEERLPVMTQPADLESVTAPAPDEDSQDQSDAEAE